MEKPRPRLLKTYSGLRERPNPGGGGGRRKEAGRRAPGLRMLPPPAPWISPPLDRRRLFSSSSSSGGGGAASSSSSSSFSSSLSSSCLDDLDFHPRRPGPPTGKRRPRKAKENRRPQEGRGSIPPTSLCRNVTHRRPPRLSPREGLRARAPLRCSTPCLPPRGTTGEESPETPLRWTPKVLRGGSSLAEDALLDLSVLTMDNEEEEEEVLMGGTLGHFGSDRRESRKEPPASTPFRSTSTPALQPRGVWSGGEAASGCCEDSAAGLRPTSAAPPQASCQRPSQGVLQAQAQVCDSKLVLFLPREDAPHASKRRQDSVAGADTPAGPNRTFSELLSDCSVDLSSPWLQPVVLLDKQVVSDWLASRSSKNQKVDCSSQEAGGPLQPKSPCSLPAVADTHPVVPACGTGTTGRKACISGFSSSRWGQPKKLKERRCKQDLGRKYHETSVLQESLANQGEDDLAFSLPSPDSSLTNSALWRRIRASFALHKKKKILSESESLSSLNADSSSIRPHAADSPQTPFTQKLGYSICPSYSMVLLSSITSFSTSKVILTDAEKVFGECQQKGPISFEECIPLEKLQNCEKIGEGFFGEVFRIDGDRGPIALKIIPIEGNKKVNGEPQKTFSEILPEIIISKELSHLGDEEINQTSGFIQLYSVHCVQGTYPKPLLDAWDKYHRLRTSENDRPDFFEDQQLFMVLEFEDGGVDLENMQNRQLNSLAAAKSILYQIATALAVAEEALRFEHRDLHWGNVLVKRTNLKKVSMTLKGKVYDFPTHGYLVNIIDYTFSRLEKDGITVYCDLSTDEEVFQGKGDYQFDIYRKMREENLNNWAGYFPHSNILWLHYLVDKILNVVSYKKKATTSSLKQLKKQLKCFSEELLGFQSAADLLNGSKFFQGIK